MSEAMMLDYYHQGVITQAYSADASTRQELAIVSSFNLVPYKDGNMWCYLLGENLQEGVAGFGKTPYQAMQDFNKNFYAEQAQQPTSGAE